MEIYVDEQHAVARAKELQCHLAIDYVVASTTDVLYAPSALELAADYATLWDGVRNFAVVRQSRIGQTTVEAVRGGVTTARSFHERLSNVVTPYDMLTPLNMPLDLIFLFLRTAFVLLSHRARALQEQGETVPPRLLRSIRYQDDKYFVRVLSCFIGRDIAAKRPLVYLSDEASSERVRSFLRMPRPSMRATI